MIDRQHTGRYARQDRLDKGPTFVQLAVCGHQSARLRLQPLRHPIESRCQRANLIARLRTGNAR